VALTKPAGCFLQFVSLPLLLAGLYGLAMGIVEPGALAWGVPVLIAGLALLYVGGRPARRAAKGG